MTEIELNEQINLLLTESASQPLSRHTGMAYRREMKVRKNDPLMRIVTRGYVPHIGSKKPFRAVIVVKTDLFKKIP